MSRRASVAAVVLLGLGVLFAPRSPSRMRVDPVRLLERTLARETAENYQEARAANNAHLIRRNYIPLVEGEEKIGGRECWVLRLKPRVKHRPWRQLWIDKESSTILALREWSHNGSIRRAARVTDPRPSALRGAGLGPKYVYPVSAGLSVVSGPHCPETKPPRPTGISLPHYLPRGFELAGEMNWPEDRTRQVVYSDGLFNISVFYRVSSTSGWEQDKCPVVVDCGDVTAARVVSRGCEVTCVADIPEELLLRVAASIRRREIGSEMERSGEHSR